MRFWSSIVLVASFFGIIYLGHVPLMFMVLGIQVRALLDFWDGVMSDKQGGDGCQLMRCSTGRRWHLLWAWCA